MAETFISDAGLIRHLESFVLDPCAICKGGRTIHLPVPIVLLERPQMYTSYLLTMRAGFSHSLAAGVGHQGLFTKPTSKCSEGGDTGVRPVNRLTSILSGAAPRSPTLRSISNPLSRLRERSSKTLSPFPSRFGAESLPDSRRNVKAERKTVRILDGASGWLAGHRRRKTESPQEFCPLHRDCRR